MRVIDINSRDILLDEKIIPKYFNLWYSYKTFMGQLPLRIRSDEIDRFIKIYWMN